MCVCVCVKGGLEMQTEGGGGVFREVQRAAGTRPCRKREAGRDGGCWRTEEKSSSSFLCWLLRENNGSQAGKQ